MKYRVHRINVQSDNMQQQLEQFINQLNGDVISVVPDARPSMWILGGAAKIVALLVVEKTR